MIPTLPVFVAQAQSQGLIGMVPLVLVLFIFYFLVLRPQNQEHKNHQALLASLKKDDRVATTGGLHGKVYEVRDHLVVLEIADKVRVIIDKASVKQRLTDGDSAASTKEPDTGASKGS
jgi:preprotein translocase subunit YajC